MNNNPPLASAHAALDSDSIAFPGLSVRGADGTAAGMLNGYAIPAKTVRRPLTDREKQILRLICDGMTNAQIATHLGIAADTVKSELKRIFRKIEVKNRTQAAMHLVRNGLL